MSIKVPADLPQAALQSQLHVAIDGPAGAGKTTIGQALGQVLECPVLDTGMMYREVTRRVQVQGVDPADPAEVKSVASGLDFDLHRSGPQWTLSVSNRALSTAVLHSEEIERDVSIVSAHPDVRRLLVRAQQSLAEGRPIVMLGRDIGTVVLPRAQVKLFLTAPVSIRAARRQDQRGSANESVDESLSDALAERDHRDETREISPLRKAPDAVEMDTARMDVDESVRRAMDVVLAALPDSVKASRG